jgi:hypothetical protein
MEIHEGLAQFTEAMLSRKDKEIRLKWLEGLFNGWHLNSELSLFGYISGALYAMLLEEAGADWKGGLTYVTDLGHLLQQAMNITDLTPFESLDLEKYGYSQVAPLQTEWANNFEMMVQRGREVLIDEPVIELGGNFTTYGLDDEGSEFFWLSRNPYRLAFFGDFTVTGTNYVLEMHGGYIESIPQPATIRIGGAVGITISDDLNQATAPTWTLTITNAEYKIEEVQKDLICIVRR